MIGHRSNEKSNKNNNKTATGSRVCGDYIPYPAEKTGKSEVL